MSSAITEIFLQPLLWTRRVEEKITLSAATFDEFLSRAKIISFPLLTKKERKTTLLTKATTMQK